MRDNYIVAVGDPFDAMNFYGPFDSFEDAEEWADSCGRFNWIIGLESPE